MDDAALDDATVDLFKRYLAQPAPRYTIVSFDKHAGIRCHGCCRISYNDMDVAERYCSCLGFRHSLIEEIQAEGRRLYGGPEHGP